MPKPNTSNTFFCLKDFALVVSVISLEGFYIEPFIAKRNYLLRLKKTFKCVIFKTQKTDYCNFFIHKISS